MVVYVVASPIPPTPTSTGLPSATTQRTPTPTSRFSPTPTKRGAQTATPTITSYADLAARFLSDAAIARAGEHDGVHGRGREHSVGVAAGFTKRACAKMSGTKSN